MEEEPPGLLLHFKEHCVQLKPCHAIQNVCTLQSYEFLIQVVKEKMINTQTHTLLSKDQEDVLMRIRKKKTLKIPSSVCFCGNL